ncbi:MULTISPECIES: spinster family MFS transporter [Pseudomonas]|uniref:spinster family MFS transporter n=1 Tax=Pseudomonas TaxID=286 RepID=UPI000D22753E|nr:MULTISPECIES: MFS transporter [Pseudomonas]AVZ17439.1 MFS transporter [Pseudomonas aeruginosa]HBO3178476.1 MFS transporter [Pseudomonas aeruginosa]HEN8625872.1 MFS transporter [Pseudomonas aeruginosa]HEN8630597.1 MFS transporter [Pseudomonas aeruginosa]HEN8809037.1 MFS transporter [Pseudomonas aeruginosa]
MSVQSTSIGGSLSPTTSSVVASSGAWTTLLILMAVYAINIADRYVLSTLIEPIKHEFQLSDASVGFLTGVALAIFYVSAGLPLGALADKTNRKRMIGTAVAVWSAMTILCGLSTGFWQLLLARIGVGIGEAGGTPPSHSIVADKFRPKLRAFALSVYGIGASVGAWFGASGAGYLNDAYGWRTTLIVFGLCGLPFALLVWLCIREPKRVHDDVHGKSSENAAFKDTVKYVLQHKALFHLIAGATVITFWGWGILWWTTSFLVRTYSLSVGEAGAILGPIHGIAGTAMMLITVFVMLQLRNKEMSNQSGFIAWTTLLGTAFSIALFATTNLDVAHILLWLFIPITYIYIGPSIGILQNLFPAGMRAKGSAILLFTANIANLAIAPQLIGLLSDFVAPRISNPDESLRYVLLGCAFTGLWATYHYWACARHMKSEAR